jgi:hypothetical protein
VREEFYTLDLKTFMPFERTVLKRNRMLRLFCKMSAFQKARVGYNEVAQSFVLFMVVSHMYKVINAEQYPLQTGLLSSILKNSSFSMVGCGNIMRLTFVQCLSKMKKRQYESFIVLASSEEKVEGSIRHQVEELIDKIADLYPFGKNDPGEQLKHDEYKEQQQTMFQRIWRNDGTDDGVDDKGMIPMVDDATRRQGLVECEVRSDGVGGSGRMESVCGVHLQEREHGKVACDEVQRNGRRVLDDDQSTDMDEHLQQCSHSNSQVMQSEVHENAFDLEKSVAIILERKKRNQIKNKEKESMYEIEENKIDEIQRIKEKQIKSYVVDDDSDE